MEQGVKLEPHSISCHPHSNPCSPSEYFSGPNCTSSALFPQYKSVPPKNYLQSTFPARHSRHSHHSRLGNKTFSTPYQNTEFNRSSIKTSESTYGTHFDNNSSFILNLPSILETNVSNSTYSSQILQSAPLSSFNTFSPTCDLFVDEDRASVPCTQSSAEFENSSLHYYSQLKLGELCNSLPSVPVTVGQAPIFTGQYLDRFSQPLAQSEKYQYDRCHVNSMAAAESGHTNVNQSTDLIAALHQLDCPSHTNSGSCNCSSSFQLNSISNSSNESSTLDCSLCTKSAPCSMHQYSGGRAGLNSPNSMSQQSSVPTRRMRSLRSHPSSQAATNQATDGTVSSVAVESSGVTSTDPGSSSPRERSESPTNRIHARHHHHRHHHLHLRASQGADFSHTDSQVVNEENLPSDCEDCDDCDDIGVCGGACDECDLVEHHSSEEELEPLTGSWQRESNGPPEKRKWSQVARLSLTDSGNKMVCTYIFHCS